MTDNHSNHHAPSKYYQTHPPNHYDPWDLRLILILVVVCPAIGWFLTWYWFWR